MSGFCGTTDELIEKIQWLEDDIASCQKAINAADDIPEKWEYRRRISADRKELAHLEQLAVLIND